MTPDTHVFLHTPITRLLLARAWAAADRLGEPRDEYIESRLYRAVVADESVAEAAAQARQAEGVAV